MKRVAALEDGIRDYVNDEDLRDRAFAGLSDQWFKLCAALDALGDTAEALAAFESVGITRNDEMGERYLRLYGALQAVTLQQDSIQVLSEILCGRKIHILPESGWKKMRDLRNLSTGHPLANTSFEKGTTKRVMLARISLGRPELMLMVWDKKSGSSRASYVDLHQTYVLYKDEACSNLEEILRDLAVRWPRLST